MTNDITIDCSTATLNVRPRYFSIGCIKNSNRHQWLLLICYINKQIKTIKKTSSDYFFNYILYYSIREKKFLHGYSISKKLFVLSFNRSRIIIEEYIKIVLLAVWLLNLQFTLPSSFSYSKNEKGNYIFLLLIFFKLIKCIRLFLQ